MQFLPVISDLLTFLCKWQARELGKTTCGLFGVMIDSWIANLENNSFKQDKPYD